jgi:hypothetical protein
MTDQRTFMYCPSCGWMHDQEGIGKPECPRCQSAAHWVKGTDAELVEFRAAITENPQNWRNFPSSDYWLRSSVRA